MIISVRIAELWLHSSGFYFGILIAVSYLQVTFCVVDIV